MLAETDIQAIGRVLSDAADAEIMPRFRRLPANAIRAKTSAFDIVTEADEAAEAMITHGLRALFPGAAIIGEEAAAADPTLVGGLASAELAILVDPIDGTKNFASNLPLFGLMAAVVAGGEVVGGVIHDPVCRDWAYAIKGRGAWKQDEAGTRSALRVAAPAPVAAMDAIAGTAFLPEPLRGVVAGNLSRLAMTNWFRCAAHEYRMAAAGFCHVLFYNRLMPWDHAAGWLIHKEAGGYSAHFDGTPYHPTHLTGGLLCAPDETSWHAVRDALLTP